LTVGKKNILNVASPSSSSMLSSRGLATFFVLRSFFYKQRSVLWE